VNEKLRSLRERSFEWVASWMRPPRRIIPTRAGLATLGAPFVLGVAAINASNNLLFILLAACLGLIVLSGILSERCISSVDAEVRSSGEAYAGEDARLVVMLARFQLRRVWPFGKTVKAISGPLFGFRVRERRAKKNESTDGRLDARIPMLEGQSTTVVALRRFDRRGRSTVSRCELTTTYPFGLLTKARDLDTACEVIVRPKRVEVPEALIDPRGLAIEGPASARRGLGTDVYGLREWDEREPPRRIHALRSARLGREVVVETEASTRPIAHLAIANLEGADRDAFERTLEVAQATIVEWDRGGFAVSLRTAGSFFPAGTPVDAMLDHLALVELERSFAGNVPFGALWLVPARAIAPTEVSESGTLAEVDVQGNLQFIESEEAAA
jgi:uncharacterized protein (DUF58 family)